MKKCIKGQIFLLHHAIIDCVSGALLCVLVVFCLAGFVALFFPQVGTILDILIWTFKTPELGILKGTVKTPELGIPKWTSKTPELGILKWAFKTPELIGILDFVLLDSNSEAGVRHHRRDHLQSLHRLWHSDDDGRQPQGRIYDSDDHIQASNMWGLLFTINPFAVFPGPRGVRLCSAEPLPGHYQPLPIYSADHRGLKRLGEEFECNQLFLSGRRKYIPVLYSFFGSFS